MPACNQYPQFLSTIQVKGSLTTIKHKINSPEDLSGTNAVAIDLSATKMYPPMWFERRIESTYEAAVDFYGMLPVPFIFRIQLTLLHSFHKISKRPFVYKL